MTNTAKKNDSESTKNSPQDNEHFYTDALISIVGKDVYEKNKKLAYEEAIVAEKQEKYAANK